VHVVNLDVVGRARNALDQLYRLVTRRAAGGENLNLSPLTLGLAPFSFQKPPLTLC